MKIEKLKKLDSKTQEKIIVEQCKKLQIVALNVIKKMYGTHDPEYYYDYTILNYHKKCIHLGSQYQEINYSWVFLDFNILYIDKIDDEYIYFKQKNVDYSQFKNKEYKNYKIPLEFMNISIIEFAKKIRQKIKNDKNIHKEREASMLSQPYAQKEIRIMEERIAQIKRITANYKTI